MADFKTIHTTYGLAAMAAAEAANIPINLTHMAVGDGNGVPVTPTEGQTALARELYRDTVNRVFQDPDAPNRFTAELIIPADEGGFVLREVGIFDDGGSLFAVGNLPDTYKPVISEGAYADTVVRLEFMVTNSGVVTLMIDPAVAVATQTWIANNVTAAILIPGGTTGQILAKDSNADGDFVWQDPSVANVIVSTIEESQTLAALQTDVILSTVTTNGLVVYVEGVRLESGAGADGWLPDVSDPDTTIVLGSSYPEGARITLVQNEPLGDVPFPLSRDQNLNDVEDKAQARTNLDVFSKAESRNLTPSSQVAHFARNTAPAGWLKANGAAISRTAYADLYAIIGTTFGVGDGFTTFNVPDLRGEFLRGWDDGRGIDTGRVFASTQADELKSHFHYEFAASNQSFDRVTGSGSVAEYGWSGDFGYIMTAGGVPATLGRSSSTGGSETRPRNVALLACIKF